MKRRVGMLRRHAVEAAIAVGAALAVAGARRSWQFRQAPPTIEVALGDFDRHLRERRERVDAHHQSATDSNADATVPERRLYDVRDLLRPALQFNRDIRRVPYSPEGKLPMAGGGSLGGIVDPYSDWGQAASELQEAMYWYIQLAPVSEDAFRPIRHNAGVVVIEGMPSDHERFVELLELLRAVARGGGNR